MPIELKCKVCGKSFKVPPCRAKTASTCSNACAVLVRAKSRERKVYTRCLACGEQFSLPQSHIDRRIYCSNKCRYGSIEWRDNIADITSAEGNPNWKGGITEGSSGYILIKSYNHPLGSSSGYLLKHRLVMENWLRDECPESPFLVKIENKLYLSKDTLVHHLNRNRLDNRRSNLVACTVGAHTLIHQGIVPEPGTYWPPWAKITVGRNKPFS